MPIISGTYIGEQSQDPSGHVTAVRWPKDRLTILYRIQDPTIYLPFMGSNRLAAHRAVARWNEALRDLIRLEPASTHSRPEDILIEFTKVNLLRIGSGSEIGYTDLDYVPTSPTQDIKRAHSRIRGYIFSFLNHTSTEAVVTHELGHALGIRGHPLTGSVMTSKVPPRADLSERDIQTIRHMYK